MQTGRCSDLCKPASAFTSPVQADGSRQVPFSEEVWKPVWKKKGDLTEWEMVIYNLLKEDTVHWSQIGVCMCADVPHFYLAFNQWSSSPSIVIYFCMLIILQPLQFKALPWESIQRGQEVKDFAAENIPVCLSWKSSPSVNPCFCMLETELTLGKPVMSTKLSTRLTGIVDY